MDIEKRMNTCIDLSKEYCHYCYEVMEEPIKTNRVYDKVQRNYKALKAIGEEGISKLCELLNHDNDFVRYCAAMSYLPVDDNKAKDVLKELIEKYKDAKEGLGVFRLSLEQSIIEWDKGNLIEYL